MVFMLILAGLAGALQPGSQDFAGRWMDESGNFITLDIAQDAQNGRVAGILTLLGTPIPFQGRIQESGFVINTMRGIPLMATGDSLTARRDGNTLILTSQSVGEEPESFLLTRKASVPAGTSQPTVKTAATATTADMNGRWEVASDDRTSAEVVELTVAGGSVSGTLLEIERGYFTGKETITGEYAIRGSVRNDGLVVTVTSRSRPNSPVAATIFRRGKYLVINYGSAEQGYARPGESLVESAAASADAATLELAIAGRVYSVGSQAIGGGAFVGKRVRVALCADHSMAFDASDLAGTPGALPGQGVDFGGTVTRRGTWAIVMFAGAPAVQASWQGTGTSYSLKGYFQIRPSTDGKSAVIDGTNMPATGRC